MISTRWLEERQIYWTRLEALLEQTSRRGLGALSRAELQELGLLYRQIAADLASVREHRGSVHVADYLNQLLARAHHTIYAVERKSPADFLRFFSRTYPRIFRQNLAPCLVSVIIFLGAAIAGAGLVYRDVDFKTRILPPAMIETIDRRQMWTHSIVSMKPIASSAIMTNNMSVALTAFASGITGGVGTAYMLAMNGLLLGVIGMACAMAGMSLQLWSFVAPHGVLELPAIVIAGGSGLRLAQGLLFPGLVSRRQSIATAGTEAVKLVLGCIPLLVVAGLVEAFVSPTDLVVAAKFGVAGALFVLLFVYLFSDPAAPGGRSVIQPSSTTGSAV